MEEANLRIKRRRELIIEQQRKLSNDDSSNASDHHVQSFPLHKTDEKIASSVSHVQSMVNKINDDISKFRFDFQTNESTQRSLHEAVRRTISKRIMEEENIEALPIDLDEFWKEANGKCLTYVYTMIEKLKEKFDGVFQRKCALTNELEHQLRGREEVYLNELKRHESQVDSLRKLIEVSLLSIEREYRDQIILIENVHNEERNHMIDEHTNVLTSLLSETSIQSENNIHEMLTNYEKKFDSMSKIYLELDDEFNVLKTKLVNDVSNLETELSVSKCLYQVSIDQIEYNHEKLISKNNDNIGKIKKKRKRIAKFKDLLGKELESARVSEQQDLKRISAFESDCKRLESQYSNLVTKLNRLELMESQKYQSAMEMYNYEEANITKRIHEAQDNVAKSLSIENHTIDYDELHNVEIVLMKYHGLLLEAIDRKTNVEDLKVSNAELETKVHTAAEKDIQKSLIIAPLR